MEKKGLVLCDTNVVFKHLRGDTQITKELDKLGFSRLALSAITVAETYFGMKKAEIRKTKEFINKFNVFLLDKNISLKFLEIVFAYRGQIQIPDAIIAATAIETNLPLFTLNSKDFDFILGVKLYKPFYAL
ncbi:type II toxin-antitoxin system VapC family toxin [Sphingobacteriales bacterium UPWRP_1]|nr:hypothetical protein BVG80_17305 [Sphingobacteriales bacterium TSM_CSM]PSJ74193.1 type II toxin-antitoxin system VapC family toxin [Sphingobacteriales bacterium UPWRP_1]